MIYTHFWSSERYVDGTLGEGEGIGANPRGAQGA